MIELDETVVTTGMPILRIAIEHHLITGILVEQFVFGEFAPFASFCVLELPVVVAELFED
jgi:hypothetical protein